MHIEILYNVTVGDKPKGNTFPLPMGGGGAYMMAQKNPIPTFGMATLPWYM
jgi:hypothetical protein